MSEPYQFRLYVAGDAPNSVRARTNLAAIVTDLPEGKHTIEEIDVMNDPLRALADQVWVTPTLVLDKDGRQLRIAGNLSERARVVDALNLPPPTNAGAQPTAHS